MSLLAGCAALVVLLAACTGTPTGRHGEPVATTTAATSTTPPSRTVPTTRPPSQHTTTPPPSSRTSPPGTPTTEAAFGAHGISAGHPAAVAAGMGILREGGNAVDAAVAGAFVMAVVEPLSSGAGGGGAALVVPMPGSSATGQPDAALAYDYREVVSGSGVVPASGTGVPGFVAGMTTLHAEHGVLPWAQVLAPAVELAEEGVPVSWFVAQELRSETGRAATRDLDQFHQDGSAAPLAEGDLLVQPELAGTLRAIADEGRDAVHDGEIADALAALQGIDTESLAGYEVDVREPARGPVGDYEVLAAAPALSGVAVIQLLQVAQAAGVAQTEPGSAAYIDTMTEAWRVADRSLQTVVGDPRFVEVPVAELTDPEANAALAADVAAGGTADVPSPDPLLAGTGRPAPGNTTHLSVVDADGLAVSMTNTITSFWGSGQEVGGFFVNDHLIRFGTGTTDANVPGPGRRTVSYMAPVVVLDGEQRPVLVLGSPGGRRIPNIQATVLARWALQDQPIQEAVEAPRFHLEGHLLRVEELPGQVAEDLASMGYVVTPVPLSWSLFGSVQALELDHRTGGLTGAVDDRRTGAWDGSG